MLKILNANNNLPIYYQVDPLDFFEPGMIGSFSGRQNNHYICGRSRGLDPVGIIDDIRNHQDDTTSTTGHITIWNADIIAETDIFEPGTYMDGHILYVSTNGKLCRHRFKATKNAKAVANVIKSPTPQNPLLVFQWRPQNLQTKWQPKSKFPHEWDGWIIREAGE